MCIYLSNKNIQNITFSFSSILNSHQNTREKEKKVKNKGRRKFAEQKLNVLKSENKVM